MARRPVDAPYTISTEFGVPDNYAKFGKHSGVDYALPAGRVVYAPMSGQLENIVSPTGGNMVVIYDGRFWHRLMHNSSFSRGNGWVNEGQAVARVGTTGLSTGNHCHWDINKQGVYPTAFSSFVSPADFLAGVFNQVIQGETMNQEAGIEMYRTAFHRDPEPGAVVSQWNGQSPAQALRAARGAEWQAIDNRLKAYDTLQAQVAELSARPTKAELQAVVQAINSERDKNAVLEKQLEAEKANIKTIEVEKVVTKEVSVEVVKETNPAWLQKAIEFINKILGKN